MASTRLRQTKDGRDYYEIRCRPGRDKSELSKRWYVPKGWSKTSIERELQKVASEFERQVKEGSVLTVKEKKKIAADAEAERAKIKTFEQYCESVYIPALKVTSAAHTISNFTGNLKKHIYPSIGAMKLPDIGSAEISALLLKAQSSLKIGSVLKLYTILKLVFKKAYLEDIISKNPMDKVERPKAKKDEVVNDEPEAYSAKEILRIIDVLENEPLQWRVYTRLLIDTGCRRGEACAVRWCDINEKENSVTFAGSLAYTPETGVFLDTSKNKKQRTVYIDPNVMKLLKQLKASKKVIDASGKGYVFTQSENSLVPLHPDSPTRYYKKLSDKYGIEHFHPHKLRHSQASIAITNGADPVSVGQKLGHSDSSVTLRIYSHATSESQKRANDIFRSALASAKKTDKKSRKKAAT